ncbi:hypothetical protein [Sphingomonas sp. CROZ-RG-20F-R02-07]|uniref:hypothetical protein n=1 Tax=Sphingomonas sp. CROZ-RG-20F-R02-07 TaxID=2914832 RepID=UPI001F5670FE|nr:hypothetical protein [Sphingomonas sp. CROZ-RG-20F-R02-07]
MNALSAFLAPPPAPAPAQGARHDGWTPDRQRGFCEAIAEGETVAVACARVGMAVSSAYALRRRATGATFALAWDGARLLGRERLGDALHERAIAGVTETIERPDGSIVTRHRYDNRLATMMLHRADRQAAAQDGAAGQAARLVAAEFDAFLDLLDREAGPARAGLFLATRLGDDAADLAPVIALARADTWLRTGAGRLMEVDMADLDPARRAEWTAGQWLRAEAAGLVALGGAAAAPGEAEDASTPPLPPLRLDAEGPDPVWWCSDGGRWMTRFPPPAGFDGYEDGDYGDVDYERGLDDAEEAAMEAAADAELAPRRMRDARERDAWFAALAQGGEVEGTEDAVSVWEPPARAAPDALEPPATLEPPLTPGATLYPGGGRGPVGTSSVMDGGASSQASPDWAPAFAGVQVECKVECRAGNTAAREAASPRTAPLPGPAPDLPNCAIAPI